MVVLLLMFAYKKYLGQLNLSSLSVLQLLQFLIISLQPFECFHYFCLDSCNFETDLCLWTNVHDGTDKFDWLRLKGSTNSQYVGPGVDHTQGKASGYYVFMESDPPHIPGDNARLTSQVYRVSPSYAFYLSLYFSCKS